MTRFSLIALAAVALTPTAHAGLLVSFASSTLDSAPPNTLTFAGDSVNPAVPAVVSIDIDGAGAATASSVTSNNSGVSDNWTVSGAAGDGFNSSFSLTISATGPPGVTPVRQRNVGGLGVNGGNPGRIDGVQESVNIVVDATGLAPGFLLDLVSIGYTNTNSVGTDDPDLVLTNYDATATTFMNIRDGGVITSPVSLAPGQVRLAAGDTGTISFSQGQIPSGGQVGYSLASLEFDIVPVPEPAAVAVLALAAATAVGRRR